MSLKDKLTQWFKSVFAPFTLEQGLDAYIASKHPTTPGEVDYWISEYDRKKMKGVLVWKL
jgi:hypothetical protein